MAIKPKSKFGGKIPEPIRLVTDTMEGTGQYLRALILGDSKSGKTHLHATFPKPLIIDCGKTLATVRAMGLKIPCIEIMPETDRSPAGALTSYTHVREVILDLLQRGGRFWDQLPYVPETLVIDHLNGLCTIMENEIVLHPPYGNRAKGPQLEKSDYNIIQRRLYIEILMPAFDLPMHLVCVSELKTHESEDGRVRRIPALTGNAMAGTIAGQFNEVLYTFKEIEVEGEGKKRRKTESFFLTSIPEKDIPYLGTRAIEIQDVIENPSFEKIMKGKGKR
jgi:hypothetical protein